MEVEHVHAASALSAAWTSKTVKTDCVLVTAAIGFPAPAHVSLLSGLQYTATGCQKGFRAG